MQSLLLKVYYVVFVAKTPLNPCDKYKDLHPSRILLILDFFFYYFLLFFNVFFFMLSGCVRVDESCSFGASESLLMSNGAQYRRFRLTCHAGGGRGRGGEGRKGRGEERKEGEKKKRGGRKEGRRMTRLFFSPL